MNINDKDLEKKKKDLNSLEQIIHLATSLQDDASRNPTGFSPWEECEQSNNFTKNP